MGEHRGGLPAVAWALKALAGDLRAVHTNLYDYAAERPQIGGMDVREEEYREEFRHLEFETEHPVVRIHPETGEPTLLLGHFVRSFPGLGTADFNDLFGVLQRHITRLENTVRWTWRDGACGRSGTTGRPSTTRSRTTTMPRQLHQVTVAGAIPVGIHDDTSVTRRAAPATARTWPGLTGSIGW